MSLQVNGIPFQRYLPRSHRWPDRAAFRNKEHEELVATPPTNEVLPLRLTREKGSHFPEDEVTDGVVVGRLIPFPKVAKIEKDQKQKILVAGLLLLGSSPYL